MLLLCWLLTAAAAPPADLDGLVALALAIEPAARSLALEGDAARARAAGAGRLMDPRVMVGVEALGAPMDAPDPMMGMVGITQMVRGFGEGRSLADRAALDADRAGVERDVVEADLRLRLWQAAARIDASEQEGALLDEEIRIAGAARDLAFARYGAGAAVAAPMGGGAPMETGMDAMAPGAPAVGGRSGGGGSMPGMGAATGGRAAVVVPPAPMTGGPTPAGAPMAGGSGLPALLRLDAEISRVVAERAALAAELEGERAVLALFVGDEASDAVNADPSRYFGGAASVAPERALAEVDRQIAEADLLVARRARRPDLMLSVAERIMPEGMPVGTDISVGVELPVWGARGREIAAAEAASGAADADRDRISRDLLVAAARGRAAVQGARARADALEATAVPRARAAWETSVALYGAGTATGDELARSWTTWISIAREAVRARRDVELRSAELARVEDR